jgi:hypothetical protein
MADYKSDILYGVGCDVRTCKYHGHDNMCHADSICVETQSSSHNARNEIDTFCGTFEPRPSGSM